MRKILVGIAFFCFLSFAQGVRTVQAAVMDVSDNFVSLKVDKKRAKFNDDFVHVQAKFSARRQALTANSQLALLILTEFLIKTIFPGKSRLIQKRQNMIKL